MILPIVAYGHSVLRKDCKEIEPEHPGLAELLENMWETMYNSAGIGLAAPQVNVPIRLFLVDSLQIAESDDEDVEPFEGEAIKQVFINPEIIETGGTPWKFNEGCLSIPKIREDVERDETVTIQWLDEKFEEHKKTFDGLTARIILHEYDHIDGKLFIDYISPLRRRLLKSKLKDISLGNVDIDYRLLLPKKV